MSRSTTQFITQMKLRELDRQRARLRESYEALRDAVASARDSGHRLHLLYEGLRELAFAGQPLHPDVVNLEVLVHAADSDAAPPDVLALWLARLEAELNAGRTRAEFVYLFGALLEDWARGESAQGPLVEEAREARARLLSNALAEVEPNRHSEVFDPLFDSLDLADLTSRMQEECQKGLDSRLSGGQMDGVLARLAADIYQPAPLRREARRFAAAAELRKELEDALTILIAELSSWDWPAEGLSTRAVWTRNKWRLYLDEDLPTACLLQVLGERWIRIIQALLGDREQAIAVRQSRLAKLIDLGAPEVILTNERRMLRVAERMVGLGCPEGIDVWGEDRGAADAAEAESVAPAAEAGSVREKRASMQASLRSFWSDDSYAGGYGEVNTAVLLVHAEVQLAQAAYPNRPLFVVKADLQDFYPSLPHDVLLDVLRRLGVPETDLNFFARFLAAPLRPFGEGETSRMRRGVPMGHHLSGMLAELFMRLVEQHLQKNVSLRIVRIVDDLCILTPDSDAAVAAWEQLEAFCEACGLRVNQAKSGAVCLGGELTGRLPAGSPRWGMLELDRFGRWTVHSETFEAHLEQSRDRLAAASSILSLVQLYNANLKYLLNAVVLGGPLGEAHRRSAEAAVLRYHHGFFGPERGIVDELRSLIRQRFLADAGNETEIPEGWIYWPITAGGLGLQNPMVVAAQYAAAYRDRKTVEAPASRPTGWDLFDNEWGKFYGQFLDALDPLDPRETKVMKTLIDDFIARGAEISAGRQRDLTPYWRWILCTYGPQILDRFGTFRFLITELVPLQLIGRKLVQDSSLDGADSSADESE